MRGYKSITYLHGRILSAYNCLKTLNNLAYTIYKQYPMTLGESIGAVSCADIQKYSLIIMRENPRGPDSSGQA